MPENNSLFNQAVMTTNEVATPVTVPVEDDFIDIDLSVTRKKKFRFDKDNSRIVELNTSDMNILARMSEAYPKLKEQQEKAAKLMEGIELTDDEDALEAEVTTGMMTVAQRLKVVDKDMRDLIDFMFNAPVSAVAAPDGSMYDPYEGSFRFEYIITLLIKQYENNLEKEFSKMAKQMEKHTAKYTKGK
jgi:hypothetical protein